MPDDAIQEIPGGGVTSATGFLADGVYCGLKTPGEAKLDLGLVLSEQRTVSAGVYTTNKLKGAALKLAIRRASAGPVRAAIVNSGNANSSTGEQGDRDALETASLVARRFGLEEARVVPASTGVIGRLLPMEKVRDGIGRLQPAADGGERFARSTLTTDTRTKQHAVRFRASGNAYAIGGCAKGSGMIHPNMATMLSFITTDAPLDSGFLAAALRRVVDRSYNMVTVDGDTSCDDMVLVLANGAAGGEPIAGGDAGRTFEAALLAVGTSLAKQIAADGEGASKLIEVVVENAVDDHDARTAARAVAGSMLTKAAVHGNDPNWGRIMNAVGYSGAEMVEAKASVFIDDIAVYRNGLPVDFDPDAASGRMQQAEVRLRVDLGLGTGQATAWGCDLTPEYVHINADYTT